MTARWLWPDQVFDGTTLRSDLALRIEDDHVAEVAPAPAGATRIAGVVSPGFVDLQVNGGGGVLVNTSPTAEAMHQIAQAHRAFGTAAVLPTVITDAPDVLEGAVEAALDACGRGGCLGLHIEGPHIALAKRGTHAAEHVRPLDGTTKRAVARLTDAGVPVMLTVAPDVVEPADIAALSAMGVVVSIGHSDATAAQTDAALAAGAKAGTHLFNAMRQMTAREPGVVGALIASQATLGMICDGHHVDDAMLALAIRARPEGAGCFLVSDAMPTVGGPDRFTLYGNEIRVDDGRLINAEGNLAGAHTTMAEGVSRLVNILGLPLELALQMAVATPARLIGLPDLCRLAGRATAECVILSERGRFQGWLDDLQA